MISPSTSHGTTGVSPQRLVLLEFLFADRFSQFRSKAFPFLLGQARALGIEARWLCAWAPPGRDSRTRYVMDHEGEAAALVLDALEAASPTHLIVTEKLAPSFAAALEARLPDTWLDDLSKAPTERIVEWPTPWLPGWLGLPPADPPEARFLVDAVEPAYETQCIDLPAERPPPSPPPVHIVVGPECIYHRPLERVSDFRDLQLPDGARTFACSFCPGPGDVGYPFETPPVELAMRQLLAALRTERRCTSRDEWVVDGGHLNRRLDALLSQILEHPFPPSRFLLSFRIDELLLLSKRLEPLMPALARAGHSLDIYNIGVENFSTAENERLNKGLRVDQVERFIALVERWEESWPDTFRFSARGGFGLILYTPWTTLDDLETNLEWIRRAGVESQGFGLTSKLQILPDAAIAALAGRDGALVETFEGFHYYDSGCFNRWDQRELPWRFLDPVVARVYEISCRLAPIRPFAADDPLCEEIELLLEERRDRFPDRFDLFEAVLTSAREDPPPESATEILERVRRDLPPRVASDRDGASQGAPSPEARELSDELDGLLDMLGSRRRRVALAGYRLASVRPSSFGSYAVVELLGEASKLVALLRRRGERSDYFLDAGPRFTLSFDQETPADTERKQRALTALAVLIERLDERARR